MKLPKFLIADNSDFSDALFVVHTEFPRFILNVSNDDVFWMEEFDEEDEKKLSEEAWVLIEEGLAFFDREMSKSE